MFCEQCGTEIAASARFVSTAGLQLQQHQAGVFKLWRFRDK